ARALPAGGRAALGRHIVVWLPVAPEDAWKRPAGGDRPLARDRDEFDALHAERSPIYEDLADAVVVSDTPRATVEAIPAIAALAELPAGTRLIWAASPSGAYPVYVGRGLLES